MASRNTNAWGAASVAFELIGVIGVCILIGWAIDRWQGWSPWGLLTGAIIGIVGGLYQLVKTAWAENKKQNPPPRK